MSSLAVLITSPFSSNIEYVTFFLVDIYCHNCFNFKVYVHVSHVLSKVYLTEKEVLTAFRENPLKSFELVRDFVEYLGFENVRGGMKFEDAFFDERSFVIEYSVEFDEGRVCVRIICSEKPYEVLRKYYEKFDRLLDYLLVAISLADT